MDDPTVMIRQLVQTAFFSAKISTLCHSQVNGDAFVCYHSRLVRQLSLPCDLESDEPDHVIGSSSQWISPAENSLLHITPHTASEVKGQTSNSHVPSRSVRLRCFASLLLNVSLLSSSFNIQFEVFFCLACC